MKTLRYTFPLVFAALLLSSCTVFQKNKHGCGDNGGRNVGAEKLLDSNAPKKIKKFKA